MSRGAEQPQRLLFQYWGFPLLEGGRLGESRQLKVEPRESSGCNLESQGLGRGPEDRASGCSGTEDEAGEECRGGQARRLRARHQGP